MLSTQQTKKTNLIKGITELRNSLNIESQLRLSIKKHKENLEFDLKETQKLLQLEQNHFNSSELKLQAHVSKRKFLFIQLILM